MRMEWLRVAAVGLCLALTACADEPERAKPVAADSTPVFPDEVAQLRERIRARLLRIQQLADDNGISGDDVQSAFFSSAWDTAGVDRLDALPAALRDEAKLLRADIVRHDELTVAAYDAPGEEGAR